MDDRAIARVIEILETDDDLVVPLKRLWLILQNEGLEDDTLENQLLDILAAGQKLERRRSIYETPTLV
jgi:hypothetical protein